LKIATGTKSCGINVLPKAKMRWRGWLLTRGVIERPGARLSSIPISCEIACDATFLGGVSRVACWDSAGGEEGLSSIPGQSVASELELQESSFAGAYLFGASYGDYWKMTELRGSGSGPMPLMIGF
jgi:hypothetical protein